MFGIFQLINYIDLILINIFIRQNYQKPEVDLIKRKETEDNGKTSK